ncbi:hypothetical protein KFL_000490025 [Klebsormidium nitens]|uniref:Uncharacterized protein n=1 Tax=Klebsormidium nitens TaxID=105231 RepID=A0A0U9HQ83_KLENI|nr:hypothetical protein KFL_000490025 [Klebsormidium nitens]|eukprot:GAQ80212.1 hypothetical protein KFL_000490025 [Klebsormidium nitens]
MTSSVSASTLPGVLDGAKKGSAPGLVVAGGGPKLTHAQLTEQIESVGAQLRSFGVKPGDLVTLAFPNTIEFVVAFLAVARIRAVAAPLNAAYKEDEFTFYIEDAKSSFLVVPKEGVPNAEAAAKTLNLPTLVVSFPSLEEGVKVAGKSGDLDAKKEEVKDAGPLPEEDDEALFLHTSGTTSRPKGVPLSHLNLATSIRNIIKTYELTSEDRTLIVMPLFHVHGLMASLLATLSSGGTVVLPAGGRFSASTFWEDALAHQITWYTAVPTIHQILLAKQKTAPVPPEKRPTLRFIRSCSSSLAPAVLEKLEAEFDAPVLEAYAMTEASHQMTSNPLPKHGAHKPGTVGKATGIELAVLDEQDRPVPTGEIGEVSIKGANVTKGYKANPEANKVAFTSGWFHTGDRGKLDSEGYLTLTGRIKELINRGGEKISPIEVDEALLAHPAVSEAVAFAAPDEKYGEEVNAAVVLNSNEKVTGEDILAHIKDRLSAFKLPKKFVPLVALEVDSEVYELL